MRREFVRTQMLIAALCLSSISAQAADLLRNPFRDLNLSVFGMVGGATFWDKREFFSADEKFKSSYDVQPRYAWGTSVPLTKLLGLEAEYSAGPSNLRITNISLNPRTSGVYDVRHHTISVNVLMHSPIRILSFRPYAAAGWDYNRFAPTLAANQFANVSGFGAVSTAELQTADKLGMNFGVGLEHKILRRVALRVDVRDHVTGTPTYGLPAQSSNSAIFPAKGTANNVVYMAGIVVRLGKK